MRTDVDILYDALTGYGVSRDACERWLPGGSDAEFATWVVQPISSALERDSSVGLPQFRAEDLLLAYRCLQEDRDAIGILIGDILGSVEVSLSRRLSPENAADACQDVGVALLRDAASPGLPHLRSYRGQAALRSWVYTVAFRRAVQLAAVDRRAGNVELIQQLCDVDYDPELALVKRECGQAFQSALQQVVERLPAKQRLLLQQIVLDGKRTVSLAEQFQVHPATMRRWIADLRREIYMQTRIVLQKQFASDVTLSSVLRLLSRLEAELELVDE